MSNSLIINVRGRLPWRRRLFSDTTTAAMWGYWLWLCRPMVGALTVLLGSPLFIGQAALALGSASGTLLLLNFASDRRRNVPLLRSMPDYEGYFGLSRQQIDQGRNSRAAVVHHSEDGRIVGIAARE
jgi:PgaD-like protein